MLKLEAVQALQMKCFGFEHATLVDPGRSAYIQVDWRRTPSVVQTFRLHLKPFVSRANGVLGVISLPISAHTVPFS